MKSLIWPMAVIVAMATGCSPTKQEEPVAPAAPEESAPASGMRAWGESTAVVEMDVAVPAGEQVAPTPAAGDPGLMQPSDPSPVPQMWGADGSGPGDSLPSDVPMLQGADDLSPGQPQEARAPVPVLNSPADLMQVQTNQVPVLQSPEDLMKSGQ